MTDYITFKYETFIAYIGLKELHQLTIPQWRKLVKLAVRQLWDNAGSLRLAIDWLEEAGVPEARRMQEEAETALKTETRSLKGQKGLNPEEVSQIKRHNNRLKADAAMAKLRAEHREKFLTIITETVPEDDLNYWINNY